MKATVSPTEALVIVALTTEKGGMLDDCRVPLTEIAACLEGHNVAHKFGVHPQMIRNTVRNIGSALGHSKDGGLGETFAVCDESWRPVMIVVLV